MSFKLLFTTFFISLFLAAGLLYYRLEFQDPVASDAAADDGSGVTSQNLQKTDENGQVTSETIAIAEYSRLLRVIEGISTIDNSIFSNNAFKTLVDFSFAVPNLAPYRSNPFAPAAP